MRLSLHALQAAITNDTRDRAIYVEVVTDPGGGTTQPMARVSVVRHHLQDVAPPQML
jgi:hypothetical protein